MMTLNLRNKLAFFKAIEVANSTILSANSAKYWPTKISSEILVEIDTNYARLVISNALVNQVDILRIIQRIHEHNCGQILCDIRETILFIDACKKHLRQSV